MAKPFTNQQVRAMINMMTKDQRHAFTISLYRQIQRRVNKLEHTNQAWMRESVRNHFDNAKNLESGGKDQVQAIERAAYSALA